MFAKRTARRFVENWRFAALKNGLLDATAYRFEFFIGVLGEAIGPVLIQLIFWYSLFKVNGATQIGGMGYAEFVQYSFTTMLFSQVRGGNLDFELAELIRGGKLSNYLLRPVSVIEFIYLRGLAPKLFVALMGLTLGVVLSPWIGTDPLRMVGAMGLALLGNVIHYCVGALFAAMAFVWEEAYGVLMVKNVLVTFLSGELIPLTLFPEKYAWIWQSTPFYLCVFGPSQYALGRWSHMDLLHHSLIGFAWLAGLALLTRLAWSTGIKRYSSLGG